MKKLIRYFTLRKRIKKEILFLSLNKSYWLSQLIKTKFPGLYMKKCYSEIELTTIKINLLKELL